jgi:hypothetical protein
MKKIVSGWELGEALVKAGIIPEHCGDVIIEVPVGGVVIIHCKMFADESILKVIPTSVEGFKIVEEPKK